MSKKKITILLIGKNSYIGYYINHQLIKLDDYDLISIGSNDCNLLNKTEVIKYFKKLRDRYLIIIILSVISKYQANTYKSFLDNLCIIYNFKSF